MWGETLQTNVLVLNIIVSLLIIAILFSDLLIPWSKPEDKSQRRIGNMGLRWGVTSFYSIVAIGIIALSIIYDLTFGVQLFIHLVALVLLLSGYALVAFSASNIARIHAKQETEIAGVDAMRREAKALYNDAMDKGDIAPEIISRLSALNDELRFVSPSNNQDAAALEKRFVDLAAAARQMIPAYSFSEQSFVAELTKLERILKDRKNTYSH